MWTLCPSCITTHKNFCERFQMSTIRSNQKCSKVVGTSSENFRKIVGNIRSGWDIFGNPGHDKTKISRIRLGKSWQVNNTDLMLVQYNIYLFYSWFSLDRHVATHFEKKSFSVIPIRQVLIARTKINTPKKTCTFRYAPRGLSGSLGNRKLTKPPKSCKKKPCR